LIGKWRTLSDCSQRDLLHDFVHCLLLAEPRGHDSAQPTIMPGQLQRPVNSGVGIVVHWLVYPWGKRRVSHVARIVAAAGKILLLSAKKSRKHQDRAKVMSKRIWHAIRNWRGEF
jgi:hypothetical protein